MMSTQPGPTSGSKTLVEQPAQQPPDGAKFSFASEPRAIKSGSSKQGSQTPNKSKYRDPKALMQQQFGTPGAAGQERPPPANIMFDRRVYRGNTYASPVLPLHAQPDPVELHRQSEARRRSKARRRAELQRRVRTPEPVQGRRHMDVQTDLYLEELSDKVPEAQAGTQTDAFLDRSPTPMYVPAKSGVDKDTQIEDGELFDFDFEVAPVVEVMVGKTLEQALAEVMEEDELETLRRRQAEFEQRRNAELAEVQRLEEAERRRTEEKERRLAESLRLHHQKSVAAAKIAARSFAASYLHDLVPSAMRRLQDEGFFYDPVEREVERFFLPWLTDKVEGRRMREVGARTVVDDIILNALRKLRAGVSNSASPPS
ncbi:Radial spoke head protein 3 [Gonapodya sp. JEL0774]|nr:Radial spoke head protein 3 [Gonapodya sp. JEL0774]